MAIKIQRPGAEANLALDRQILKAIARVLQRYLKGDTDLEAIVDELVSTSNASSSLSLSSCRRSTPKAGPFRVSRSVWAQTLRGTRSRPT